MEFIEQIKATEEIVNKLIEKAQASRKAYKHMVYFILIDNRYLIKLTKAKNVSTIRIYDLKNRVKYYYKFGLYFSDAMITEMKKFVDKFDSKSLESVINYLEMLEYKTKLTSFDIEKEILKSLEMTRNKELYEKVYKLVYLVSV